jgi:hypothetical protein
MASCSIQTRVPDEFIDAWWRGDATEAPLGVDGRDSDSDDKEDDSITMID